MFKNLDVPFCRKVLDFAEESHGDFTHNQSLFYRKTECGTSGCIAGIACILDPDTDLNARSDHAYVSVGGKIVGWDERAEELMGLTASQAQKLFYETMWMSGPEASARNVLRGFIEGAERERLHADVKSV